MITTHADRIDADLLTRVFCVRSTELRIGDAVNFITILEFRDAQPHGFNDA
jgi:hypothetical protein